MTSTRSAGSTPASRRLAPANPGRRRQHHETRAGCPGLGVCLAMQARCFPGDCLVITADGRKRLASSAPGRPQDSGVLSVVRESRSVGGLSMT